MLVFFDRYGWPVERIKGRAISNFFRLLLHTRKVGSAAGDPTWCRPCRLGMHEGHTDDGYCKRDNSFNADCRCPRRNMTISFATQEAP